jgi:outer membrane protein insertion porin family/translocation and assembly module TamA
VLPSLLSLALFADAGEVWTRRPGIGGERRVRVTPGAGVRVRSLFGAIRVDLGYNPYAPRSGAAYYLGTLGSAREQVLYCVSPGNRLVVTPGTAETPGRQAEGRCDPAFRPSRAQGFFRRLNPSIWIGQAF